MFNQSMPVMLSLGMEVNIVWCFVIKTAQVVVRCTFDML